MLTLPEDSTIIDVCENNENREYIPDFSPNYKAKIADSEETETEEEAYVHLPVPANYTVEDTYYGRQNYLNHSNYAFCCS